MTSKPRLPLQMIGHKDARDHKIARCTSCAHLMSEAPSHKEQLRGYNTSQRNDSVVMEAAPQAHAQHKHPLDLRDPCRGAVAMCVAAASRSRRRPHRDLQNNRHTPSRKTHRALFAPRRLSSTRLRRESEGRRRLPINQNGRCTRAHSLLTQRETPKIVRRSRHQPACKTLAVRRAQMSLFFVSTTKNQSSAQEGETKRRGA